MPCYFDPRDELIIIMKKLSMGTGAGAAKTGKGGGKGKKGAIDVATDTSNNGKIDSSGHKIGKRKSTAGSPARVPARRTVDRTGKEYEKGKKETRESTKVQSRGQAKPPGSKGKG